jgi:hypothetical protein
MSDDAPASSPPGTAGSSSRSPFLSIAEQKQKAIEKAKANKARKKLRAQQEIQRKKQDAVSATHQQQHERSGSSEKACAVPCRSVVWLTHSRHSICPVSLVVQLDGEIKRARELSNHRWKDCLTCLQDSVPRLKSNPWLIVLEPTFIHNYLDSLTETLANLSKHEEDLDAVRGVLQDVYEAFVDVGRFAKYQPAFFIQNPYTIKRFVRLLEQVAHRGSDKALFPNVLSLLGPTFEREELYDILGESRIVHSLMSFVRTDWMPSHATLALLLAIIEQLSSSALLRELFMEDPGFPKLQALAMGTAEGFSKDQQLQAQQALALYPPPKPVEPAPEQIEQESLAAAAANTAQQAAAQLHALQTQQTPVQTSSHMTTQPPPPDTSAEPSAIPPDPTPAATTVEEVPQE